MPRGDPGGAQRIEQSFPILELLEYRLGSLDFAVVRLGGNPGASFGRAQVSTADANSGEMLCVIEELGATLVQHQGELQLLGARYQELVAEYQAHLARG